MRVIFSKGFTLVEMVATLIIIALIAVVTGPRFFDVSAFRASGFFEETLSAIRFAQKHAVATGCPVRVQTTATGFTLFRPASAAACTTGPYSTPLTDPSGNATTFTRTAPSSVSLTAADFNFTASGTTTTATPTITITVGNRQFKLYRETGFVERL
ncbi:MAG: GspH/FimT family pseudopilin [Sulfuricaulis sp.]|nr:GspH/FimT family pseudopilin [Sulfuricaulis sp.]